MQPPLIPNTTLLQESMVMPTDHYNNSPQIRRYLRLTREGKEIWRDVRDYEGIYQVSSFGRVKSLERVVERKDGSRCPISSRILKPFSGGAGYWYVQLCGTKHSVKVTLHSIVLETFIGPRPNGLDCCHKDGNPSNNHLDNLRYDTRSNNMKDSVVSGTFHSPTRGRKGSQNIKAKLTEKLVVEIRECFLTGRYTYTDLGRLYGVRYDTIRDVVQRRTWQHVPKAIET